MDDNHIPGRVPVNIPLALDGYPLVHGGQGRSASDLTASARVLAVFLVLGVIGLAALAVTSWL